MTPLSDTYSSTKRLLKGILSFTKVIGVWEDHDDDENDDNDGEAKEGDGSNNEYKISVPLQ